ncbi:MAG: hypothetical protein J5682_05800 [Prevotella sp.]|nr:hypothetical protein [Prevotella sp.]
MRRNLIFLALGVAVIGFLVYVASLNKSYLWIETYSHTDDQPFGCQWFDSIAATTLPQGYTYYKGDFQQLMRDKRRKSLLVINTKYYWDSLTIASLDSFIRAGNKLMLVSDMFDRMQNEWLRLEVEERSYNSFSTSQLIDMLKGEEEPDTIVWTGSDTLRVPFCKGFLTCFVDSMKARYTVNATVTINDVIEKEVADSVVTIYEKRPMPVSVKRQVGKGTLYVVLTPLFFTNYGALEPAISQYLNRQMSQIADLSVVRLDAEVLRERSALDNDNLKMSPFRFMLSQAPLRWALYTILVAAVIFICFTARRRQRVIPVMGWPVNRNLEFARLIGSIYCRRHDNLDLIKKKYVYFKEDLRRTMMIDLDDLDSDESHARQLATQTGASEQQVSELLGEIRQVIASDTSPSDKDTIRLIRQMNYLTRR